ncbi:MAG TPA: NAD(P)H-dependent oxidoreductase [Patescibacteria group bacterium]|nr:NAD(P)H-dependent oxidoreductase [Patescibacteria group bacterium]
MITKQQILDGFNYRFAAKEFDPDKKISGQDFEFLLEIAKLSPSSFGLEPWNIVVVQSPELRKKMLEYTWGAKGNLLTASHFVLFSAKTQPMLEPGSEYVNHIMQDIHHIEPEIATARKEKYGVFLAQDTKIMDTERGVWDWAGKQTYIALANMLTSAALIGIDSCPIEGFKAEPLERLLRDESLIDGKDNRLVVMAAFGYRANPPKRAKTRRPIEEIVSWA